MMYRPVRERSADNIVDAVAGASPRPATTR